jgi:hypothetical protein
MPSCNERGGAADLPSNQMLPCRSYGRLEEANQILLAEATQAREQITPQTAGNVMIGAACRAAYGRLFPSSPVDGARG